MSPLTICLSVIVTFIRYWLQNVSKCTNVLEDTYVSTVAIPKRDEEDPSAGGKQQIHQNQNICPRESTKELISWKDGLSIFSDWFLSLIPSICPCPFPLQQQQQQVAIPLSLSSPGACPQRNSSCAGLHAQLGFPARR